MIVVDSSVLVAIIKGEAGSDGFLQLLTSEASAIGAPTLVEARIWCRVNRSGGISRWLEDFVDNESVTVVAFTRDMSDVAARAFAQFGRASGHPAKLNFGGCMAYAVAAAMRLPLLFKGSDFGLTDITAHSGSIRK